MGDRKKLKWMWKVKERDKEAMVDLVETFFTKLHLKNPERGCDYMFSLLC